MSYPEGEWTNEPNQETWTDPSTGIACHIRRHRHMGHLCGYVRVPDDHPLARKSYNDSVPDSLKSAIEKCANGPVGKRGTIDCFVLAGTGEWKVGYLFDVHGGITYSNTIDGEEGHWIGFDCSHCYDLSPGMIRHIGTDDVEYRNWSYVKAECESLAHQLKELGTTPDSQEATGQDRPCG